MPRINISSLGRSVFSKDDSKVLLEIVQEAGIDWMHACGGKGRCTTCKIEVRTGSHNLSDPTKSENNYHELNLLKSGERLSCQCRILGDVEIAIPRSSRFPHMTYFD